MGASEFFRALWKDVGAGYIEIRPKEEGSSEEDRIAAARARRLFHWPSEADDAAKYCESLNGRYHVFFGVGLRKRNRKPAGQADFQLGAKENVGAVTAVFADFDFKDVPEEDLRKALAAFPLRPSIVVKSGHGIHVYWLLDYPAMGEKLEALQAVNLGILARFRAQRGVQDYSRILRVPGTLNIKAKYPDPKPATEVSYFHPEKRYKLEEFEALLAEDIKNASTKSSFSSLSRPAGGGADPGKQSPGPAAPVPVINERPSGRPRPVPSATLPAAAIDQIGDLFAEIWIEGQRHAMALRVAGMLAFANVSQECAEAVVARASNKVGGDTGKRLLDVRDTYKRFISGGDVVGGPDMGRMIEDEFPAIAKDRAKKVLDQIRRLLPQPSKKPKKTVEPDFEIVMIEKFNSRPALYTVKIKKLGQDEVFAVERCEHKEYHYFNLFRPLVNEETDHFIANIDQWQWEKMRDEARVDGRLKVEAAPQEASVTGSLDNVLEGFLEEKKENPKLGELKSFPGYGEKGVYFKLDAFKSKIRSSGIRTTDQVITEFLRKRGWEDRRWRVEQRNPRLWCKSLNGHSSGNGHSSAPNARLDQDLFSSGEGV